MGKIIEFLKKVGSKIKTGVLFVYDGIKLFLHKFIKVWKIPLLIKRFFHGLGFGIYAGIKDGINSWKFERGKIEDYFIEINGLSFHQPDEVIGSDEVIDSDEVI